MALNASMNWWVRAGGSASNGGGFDAAVAGAGTNYADQDTAQVVFSAGNVNRLSTSGAGATTVTSAGTPFTNAMVGNVIRISGGTNFQTGYYTVVTYTDASNVVLDRTPTSGGAGADGVGSLGGAFATPWGNLSTGGTVSAPAITSPLAAGHTINVRGSGVDTPGSADYNFAGNYATFPAGSAGAGRIKIVGYNGRPRIDCAGLGFQSISGWYAENLGCVMTAATYNVYGFFSGDVVAKNIRVDQAGYDVIGLAATAYFGCRLVNSGSTSAGTKAALGVGSGTVVYGTFVNGWRGPAIDTASFATNVRLVRSVFSNCRAAAIPAVRILSAFALSYLIDIVECSFFGNAYDGLGITGNTTYDAEIAGTIRVLNNAFVSNGGYGIRLTGTLAVNDRLKAGVDYNAFYGNTSGEMYLLSAGDNDITLSADPFTDGANGDFSLNSDAGGGALLKGAAFPDF